MLDNVLILSILKRLFFYLDLILLYFQIGIIFYDNIPFVDLNKDNYFIINYITFSVNVKNRNQYIFYLGTLEVLSWQSRFEYKFKDTINNACLLSAFINNMYCLIDTI